MNYVLVLLLLVAASPAWAEPPKVAREKVTISWDTTNPDGTPKDFVGIQYELVVSHFASVGELSIGSVNPAQGGYAYTFGAPLPVGQPTDDRWICVKARAYKAANESGYQHSAWISTCAQVESGTVILPPPLPPTGLVISSATPDRIVITATVTSCPHIHTSTRGSTATQSVRTLTCAREGGLTE